MGIQRRLETFNSESRERTLSLTKKNSSYFPRIKIDFNYFPFLILFFLILLLLSILGLATVIYRFEYVVY